MAKKVLTTGKFTYNSVVYGVTSMESVKSAEEVDVTDTDTTGNEREYLASRQSRTISIEMWKDVTLADPALATAYAGELNFEGFKYSGDIILTEISQNAAIDGAVQLLCSGRFSGTVTETPEP